MRTTLRGILLFHQPIFAGKIIPADGYFIISRELANSDILSDITLSPNNSLALKSPDEKISDEMDFGTIEDNQSVGRRVWPTERSRIPTITQLILN